jgi:transposase-like protein
MRRWELRELILAGIQELNEEKRDYFEALGKGKRYTNEQKQYAFQQIKESGIRATARALQIPRRTLQRWCRKYHIPVKRCPSWVYEWAERRRKRREFWERRGYY